MPASSDEVLTLVAQVRDEFSDRIINMNRQLAALGEQLKKTHKAGTAESKEHSEAFNKLREGMRGFTEHVRTVAEPVLEAFGITTLTVAGAVAAVTKAVVDFGNTGRNIVNIAHFTGMTTQQVKVMEELAESIGDTSEAADRFMTNLATNMNQFQRFGLGPIAEFFGKQSTKEMRDFGQELRNTRSEAEQIQKILNFLADPNYSDVQKNLVANAIGLGPAWASAGDKLKELKRQAEERVEPISAEAQKRLEAYNKAMSGLRISWHELSESIAIAIGPSFTLMANNLSKFLDKHREDIGKFFAGVATAIENFDWKDFGETVGKIAHLINVAVTATIGWKGAIEFLLAVQGLRFVSWLTGVGPLLRGIAAVGTSPLLAQIAFVAGAAAGPLYNFLIMLKELKEKGPGVILDEGARTPEDKEQIEKNKRTSIWEALRNFRFHPLEPTKPETPFQHGGIVAGPTHALIGEAGPEAVLPLSGSSASRTGVMDILAAAVRKGVFDGMVDFWQFLKGAAAGGGAGAAAAAAANFVTGGGGGGGGGGAGGFHGGGDGTETEPTAPAAGAPGGGTFPKITGGAASGAAQPSTEPPPTVTGSSQATGGGSPYLAGQRAGLFADFDKWSEKQKLELAVLMRWENSKDPQVILESMANRALAEKGTRANREGSLWRAMHNRFYGPINTGGVARTAAGLSAAQRKALLEKLDQWTANVRGGSDVLEGRTDQGMLSDPGTPRTPEERARRRLKNIHGEWFSDKLGTERYVHADRARKEVFDAAAKAKKDEEAKAASAHADSANHGRAQGPFHKAWGVEAVKKRASELSGGHGTTLPEIVVKPMAEGGIVNEPTFAMIGERGPEAIIPLDRESTFSTVNKTALALARARHSFAAQLQDPKIHERLLRLTQAENPENPQAFMENVMNRAAARGKTLMQAMNDKGYYPGVSLRGKEPINRAGMEAAREAVLSGSNLTNFATGNASLNVGFGYGHGARDPYTYRDPRSGERYGIENNPADLAFAREMSGGGVWTPNRTEASTERHRGSGELLHTARRAGVTGHPHKIHGHADLNINLKGMSHAPRRAMHTAMFHHVPVKRGHQPRADARG